ncbi:integrative conjugative element protein, RAQPRD family [Denitromonas iodatirespirans]|uniref:RAQPRD family integrative conjugative element protein n=1 Tax=Denitromonas iodatirespirans TaxID=2795389 RepID=A0A944H7I3_DENI1|nr:RAQPRD family integrative conjugative element protein [Denitromonas iodatirespirans]MBT0960340.1 RAQPRD family integrative conjugative element protein [Denitromonas iodatirespirans]
MKRLMLPALLAALASGPALADESLERENLARIQHELRLIQAQVRDAAGAADTTGRVRFRYDWLTRDLDLMAAAIDEHLDAPRQPRAVAPLRGDYRQ